MGRLTTHVLDTANGRPGGGIAIDLSVLQAGAWKLLKTVRTNAEGRTDAPLLEGEELEATTYEIVFVVGEYFAAEVGVSDPPFLGRVPVRFGIADASAHYHVPLLASPWSYSTYRGS